MSDWETECDHSNVHTTYEDDCGAELENENEEPTL